VKDIFPDIFLGLGKNGIEGDASLNENHKWTLADKYVEFVVW
jgi:hypothetical protein